MPDEMQGFEESYEQDGIDPFDAKTIGMPCAFVMHNAAVFEVRDNHAWAPTPLGYFAIGKWVYGGEESDEQKVIIPEASVNHINITPGLYTEQDESPSD